jgi:hypothetical protein
MELRPRIDLPSPRWVRRTLLLGVPVAAMGVANLATSAPKQFTAGELLKAADLNAAFADVDGRLTALDTRTTAIEGASPTWTTYTPSVMSGPVAAPGTTKALYRVVGDTIEVQFSTTLGTCPNANVLTWSLPAGFTVDAAKLADGSLPTGSVVLYNGATNAVTITAAATQSGAAYFAVEKATAGGGLPCASGLLIKGSYWVPIVLP